MPGPASMKTCRLASLLPVDDVEGKDEAVRRRARFDEVELRLVGREGKPVRAADIGRDRRRFSGHAVDAIDVLRQFLLLAPALVIAEEPEGRIGEPDRIVRFHDHVIRRIEPLALVAVDEHRDRAVIFGARHAPSAMLAGDEPSLPVARIAIGEVRGLAEDARRRPSPPPISGCGCSGCRSKGDNGRRRTRPGLRPSVCPLASRSTAALKMRYGAKDGSRISIEASG